MGSSHLRGFWGVVGFTGFLELRGVRSFVFKDLA